MVDIDIKGFFDNVNHGKLLKQMWTLGIRDKTSLSITLTDTTAEVIKTEKRGFNMTNYTITKDNGITKISASAKSEVNEVITKALADAFGEENVAMVRTSGSSPVNCLAIRVGTLTDESGFEHDLCVTVDTTVKSYKDRVTKRYTVESFDFETAIARYEKYLLQKRLTKQAEAAAKKTEGKAKGNKTKSEKQAEIAARAKELDEVAERVKAKQEAELAEKIAKAREKKEKGV